MIFLKFCILVADIMARTKIKTATTFDVQQLRKSILNWNIHFDIFSTLLGQQRLLGSGDMAGTQPKGEQTSATEFSSLAYTLKKVIVPVMFDGKMRRRHHCSWFFELWRRPWCCGDGEPRAVCWGSFQSILGKLGKQTGIDRKRK